MSTDLRPVEAMISQITHSLAAAVERELDRRGWNTGAVRVVTELVDAPTTEEYLNGAALVRKVFVEWPRPRRLLLVERTWFVHDETGFTLKQEISSALEWEKTVSQKTEHGN